MQRTLPLWSSLFLLCAASAHAQLYKWVGPDGKVSYSDTPPPAVVRQVETKSLAVGQVNTSGFPYELAQAVKGHPVTLYTAAECNVCNEGRSFLNARGIPFSEKTVSSADDIVQFKKISSDGKLPVLHVGRSKEIGFEESLWNTALTAAGYPASSRLPRTYRNPPPTALVDPQKPVASAAVPAKNEAETLAAPTAVDLPPATGNAPPGFRF